MSFKIILIFIFTIAARDEYCDIFSTSPKRQLIVLSKNGDIVEINGRRQSINAIVIKPMKSIKQDTPQWELSHVTDGDYILLGRVTKNYVLISTLPFSVNLNDVRINDEKKCYIHLPPSQTTSRRSRKSSSFGFKKKKKNIVLNDEHGGADRLYKLPIRKGTTSRPFRIDCERTCPTLSIEKRSLNLDVISKENLGKVTMTSLYSQSHAGPLKRGPMKQSSIKISKVSMKTDAHFYCNKFDKLSKDEQKVCSTKCRNKLGVEQYSNWIAQGVIEHEKCNKKTGVCKVKCSKDNKRNSECCNVLFKSIIPSAPLNEQNETENDVDDLEDILSELNNVHSQSDEKSVMGYVIPLLSMVFLIVSVLGFAYFTDRLKCPKKSNSIDERQNLSTPDLLRNSRDECGRLI